MLRILVVEDNQEKLRKIHSALTSDPECPAESIDYAHDAMEAKRLMEQTAYELLIVDISIPERPEDVPSPNGGIHLLEEVIERDIYKQPREIIGLTAYADILENAGLRFAEDLWLVILYDPASETWADQLRRKVKHIRITNRNEPQPYINSDLCIIVALQNPELSSVLELPWNWAIMEMPNDDSVYYKGQFESRGQTKSVYAAAASRIGMAATVAMASKMIYTFRPRYVAMAGIIAGVKGKCEFGDIIAADPTWDYGSGKHLVVNGVQQFSPAPHQLGLNSYVRGKLGLLARDVAGLAAIQQGWKGPKPSSILTLHVGPVASGAAVLQDASVRAEIEKQHRKLLGIEMETYGLFSAVDDAPLPQPKAISLKSVADFADENKDDDFQAYAAYTSANALKLFVEKYL
jgi:nucleoside phosphorylase